MLPKMPLTIDFAPERITELSAVVAARFAIVSVLVFLPPNTELIAFVLRDLATDVAAFVAAL